MCIRDRYYPVKLYISKRSRGEDGMSSGFEKTVMVWAETKEASSTSESDESSTEPIGFALGENQSTPQANYNEAMNFNMNLRNLSLIHISSLTPGPQVPMKQWILKRSARSMASK